MTRGLIKVSNQSVATVRKSQLLGSQLTILDTKKEEFPTAVVALRRRISRVKSAAATRGSFPSHLLFDRRRILSLLKYSIDGADCHDHYRRRRLSIKTPIGGAYCL